MASSSDTPARTDLPVPVRTCIGCRERAAKSELLRVVTGSDPDGCPVVEPDPESVRAGRGAHLHPTLECFELAVRRKAFGRALRDARGPDPAPVARHLAERPALTTDTDPRPETGASSS